MEVADTAHATESLGVRIMTLVVLPFVLAWLSMRSLAQALAAMARRVGTALRITLSTMADGLRHIVARSLVLARAVAELLLRPLRLAFAAARRLAVRLGTILRSLAIVVTGVLILALAKAASIARDIIRSASCKLSAALRPAATWVRRSVDAVSAAVQRATRRAAERVRSAGTALRVSVSAALRRAAALTRQASTSLRLAVAHAKRSVVSAAQSARDLLARLWPTDRPGDQRAPGPPEPR